MCTDAGHNHLAYHESKMDPSVDPKCSLCKQDGTLETTKHFLTECDALAGARLRTFGTHEPEAPYQFTIPQAAHFLREYTGQVGWIPAEEDDQPKIITQKPKPKLKGKAKPNQKTQTKTQ